MKNKKYSLLIIALYCYPGHVKAVVDHLKARNPLVDITLLTEKSDKFKNILADRSVKIESYDVKPVNCKYRWLRFLMIKHKQRKFFSLFCKNKKYDIVNIHFANRYMSYVYNYLRSMTDNLVLTPWGSDILRRDSIALKQLSKIYNLSDYVATSSKTILGRKIIEDLKVSPNKFVGNFFGSDVIDYAVKNNNTITQEEAKKTFGIQDRFVITCGYNGIINQRHKEIITAIGVVKDRLPQNLTLLFPMTYIKHKIGDYVGECQEECEKRGIDAIFLTDYLSVEDVYKMRMATDIFVHIQTTDAGSATIQEYILCDKKIVHGSWLKNDELETFQPLFYFPVENLEELGEVIVKAYNSENIEIPQGVIDYVKCNGWESKATQMNDFFMSIV